MIVISRALRWGTSRGVVHAMGTMLGVSLAFVLNQSMFVLAKQNRCANSKPISGNTLAESTLDNLPRNDATLPAVLLEVPPHELGSEVSHESVAAVSNESNNAAVSLSNDGKSSLSSDLVLHVSNQLVHRKPCLVRGCTERIAPSMWRQHMTLHAQGFFPGAVPDSWLQEQNLFICPRCQGLVANSRLPSHQLKCPLVNNSVRLSTFSPSSTTGAMPSPLPTFEAICVLPVRTVRHIPAKDRQAVALVLSSSLRAAAFENTQEAWLKVFMLPKCTLFAPKHCGRHHKPCPIRDLCDLWSKGHLDVLWNQRSSKSASPPVSRNSGIQTAISYAREGLFSKACQALLSSGLDPNNHATWNLLVSKHPKSPLLSPPSTPSAPLLLPPDFDLKAILHSFPKGTACGPSGLRVQHLIEVAVIPMQSPICAALRDIINLLLSGKAPVSVATFMAGGSLVALQKNKPNCPLDVHPIAVGETLRRLASKCICAIVKNKASEFFSPFQLGVACPSGAEKKIHDLRSCVDDHWLDGDFAVMKIV